ncbi:hypothetical protein NDU88_005172 [Pleurodeles waltl]|uniref:Uncharacterized protein n=1 Tax=Pleurodeles waltl TaxID=8319 RepID=A0AAV7WTZ7_PLEWA|nr:hypothetical protein NDU88_005172 [Pleurodeles waltl]
MPASALKRTAPLPPAATLCAKELPERLEERPAPRLRTNNAALSPESSGQRSLNPSEPCIQKDAYTTLRPIKSQLLPTNIPQRLKNAYQRLPFEARGQHAYWV